MIGIQKCGIILSQREMVGFRRRDFLEAPSPSPFQEVKKPMLFVFVIIDIYEAIPRMMGFIRTGGLSGTGR
jgi:hypothetical protein